MRLLRRLEIGAPEFRHPLPQPMHTAVLGGARFAPSRHLHDEVTAETEVVAAPLAILLTLAPTERLCAVVLLRGETEGFASPKDRDRLWTRLGVPVFEYWLDANGAIAAWECEAHSGVHLREGEGAACPCGRPEPLLRAPALSPEDYPLSPAATPRM